MSSNDATILRLIDEGTLRVNVRRGYVYFRNNRNRLGVRTAKGYLRACVRVDGRKRFFRVHRIVWLAAHGAILPGWEVDHVNRRPRDNRLANLEAVTQAENLRRQAERRRAAAVAA